MNHFDAIVLGTGAVGSAALAQLAARGLKVLGIDRFAPGHDRGSSHGQTRLIRLAYFEHPDYVPLLLRAYEVWRELEAATGERLYHEVGVLEVGPPGGAVIAGVKASAKLHGLPVEAVSATDVARRFPGFQLADGTEAVLEPRAGYLLVERAVMAQAQLAQSRGAELAIGETVRGWTAAGGSITVETDRGRYSAGRLVISAGAWAGRLLADLRLPLRVLRKVLLWFEPNDEQYDVDRGCPAFLFETQGGYFYGFPRIDQRGVKVAEHSGGSDVADPLAVDRSLRVEDTAPVERFNAAHLPGLSNRVLAHEVCMYTMTPDENFIIDLHPDHPQVAFAAGLSGHGFKFAAVLGEILCELAVEGRSKLPIEFLSVERPALTAGRDKL